MTETTQLKKKIIKLLKEDEEFRYTVAGLIGLDEILRRLEVHDKKFNEILERLDEHSKKLESHDRKFNEILERLDIHQKRLEVHDGKFNEVLERLDRHEEEIIRLREEMRRGFELIDRHISALGARWGIMAESSFREGLKGIIEKELGLKTDRWVHYDDSGYVYGKPSPVEIDIATRDQKIILIEVSSHVRKQDIAIFAKKIELYMRMVGRQPERTMIIAPYIDEEAKRLAEEYGIEIYTGV